jgi:hypothetical protein
MKIFLFIFVSLLVIAFNADAEQLPLVCGYHGYDPVKPLVLRVILDSDTKKVIGTEDESGVSDFYNRPNTPYIVMWKHWGSEESHNLYIFIDLRSGESKITYYDKNKEIKSAMGLCREIVEDNK